MLDVAAHLWAKAEPTFFITREQFYASLAEWDVAIHDDAFVSITRGAEFHFESLETGRQLTRKMIVAFVQKIIDSHGYAITRTPHEDVKQQRFNLLFGFVEIERDAYDVIYRIERIKGCR